VVPLRPLTVGEILDGAVKVIRRYPKPTLGMSAIVAVVTTVISVLSILATDYSGLVANLQENADSGTTGFNAGFGGGFGSNGPSDIVGGIVGFLASLVLTGALVQVVGKAVLGESTTFGEVWAKVRGRLWALVGLSILTGLLVIAPSVVGVLVAIVLGAAIDPVLLVIGIPVALAGFAGSAYLWARLSLAPAVLVLEKASITQSMKRSTALVKGSWWRVFWILVLISLLTSVIAGVLLVPFAFIAGFQAISNPDVGHVTVFLLLVQIGSGLASFLLTPFTAGARALLYVDRRMRAEGLDLALQAAARG